MTGIDILMVSVLLENTVQRDILEPYTPTMDVAIYL